MPSTPRPSIRSAVGEPFPTRPLTTPVLMHSDTPAISYSDRIDNLKAAIRGVWGLGGYSDDAAQQLARLAAIARQLDHIAANGTNWS